MKLFVFCLMLSVVAARADVSDAAFDAVKKQMELLQQQMQELQEKLKAMQAARTNVPPTSVAETAATTPMPVTPAAWSPGQPITVARAGSAYMNVSFDTLMNVGWSTEPKVDKVLELGDHDPSQRGFSLRNAELSLDGAVDPYLKGFANIVLKLDNNNGTEIELEEAYGQSTALPWNLQLKAGQFFAAFGRQNQQHPHAWAFVDQPLIMNRVLGGDGLRNVGTQLSWLAPTPFYSELALGVFNGEGSTAYSFRDPDNTYGRTPVDRGLRGPGDLLFVPRASAAFDLNDEQTLVVGTSAAFGPNDSGTQTRTEIYGVDTYWKWKSPAAHGGFPFVSWQTEAMLRRYEAGADATVPLPAATLTDVGVYSQVLWGYRLNWVAGLRGEYVNNDQAPPDPQTPGARGDRFRLSPNLTWYSSEFSKLRLQYNYDHGQVFGDDHSVWMQIEFLLGAHAAHKF
ncbi:MAG: hypothetical protein WCS70_14155 [Verrucomicrobiota bacterium]